LEHFFKNLNSINIILRASIKLTHLAKSKYHFTNLTYFHLITFIIKTLYIPFLSIIFSEFIFSFTFRQHWIIINNSSFTVELTLFCESTSFITLRIC